VILIEDRGACRQGVWLWSWKDSIDRAWMARYGEGLPFGARGSMQSAAPNQADAVARAAGPEALEAVAASATRCGGCGAKVRGAFPADCDEIRTFEIGSMASSACTCTHHTALCEHSRTLSLAASRDPIVVHQLVREGALAGMQDAWHACVALSCAGSAHLADERA
jgi:hypothetical protein